MAAGTHETRHQKEGKAYGYDPQHHFTDLNGPRKVYAQYPVSDSFHLSAIAADRSYHTGQLVHKEQWEINVPNPERPPIPISSHRLISGLIYNTTSHLSPSYAAILNSKPVILAPIWTSRCSSIVLSHLAVDFHESKSNSSSPRQQKRWPSPKESYKKDHSSSPLLSVTSVQPKCRSVTKNK